MKGFNPIILARQTPTWVCRRCANQTFKTTRPPRWYATQGTAFTSNPVASTIPRTKKSNKGLVTLAIVGGLGALGYAYKDEIRHGYLAAERSARVVNTLYRCIRDYQTTLRQNEGIADREERSRNLRECHRRCAKRTMRACERNGSIFIKLGQHLSALNYLLPIEWTSTFIPLQDKCPVSSIESLEAMFFEDTGAHISDFFSEFAQEPIGAASLAQVHLATLKETGQKVCVKVQHPALAEWAPLDLWLTRFSFAKLKQFFPEYDLEWLSSEMDTSLPQELDFTNEAKNALRTKEYFSPLPYPLVIPSVIWAKKRIMVMENVSGHRLDDLEYLDSHNINRDEVSAALARIFNEMIFGRDAPLHCDPHGGNLAIRHNPHRRGANFDIILYDHGLYRDIPLDLRRSYAKLWLAVIDADEGRMRKYAHEVAGVTDAQFPLFASAITGRDYMSVTSAAITQQKRGDEERKHMSGKLAEGNLLSELIGLLGQVPRIMLLILKTNDLTRSLDENLKTKEGPMRGFLILARYASRTVWEEEWERIWGEGGWLAPIRLAGAWIWFARVELKLEVFELWLKIKRTLALV